MPSGLFCQLFGTVHFQLKECVVSFYDLPVYHFIEIPEFNANSVDPDQIMCSMASDLGLHCLPLSLLWDARYIWINVNGFTSKGSHSDLKYFCLQGDGALWAYSAHDKLIFSLWAYSADDKLMIFFFIFPR